MSVLEKEIEAKLIRRAQEELGAVSLKTHVKNWPDRVFFLPGGVCFFVETKRPKGGRLSPGQRSAAEQLIHLDYRVYTAWSFEDVDEIIDSQK